MSNAAKSGDPGVSEAATRGINAFHKWAESRHLDMVELQRYGSVWLQAWQAASAEVSELRDALNVAISFACSPESFDKEQLAANWRAILKKHGDGI